MSEKKSQAAVELGRKRAARITSEERSAWARERWASMPEEHRKALMEKVRKARG